MSKWKRTFTFKGKELYYNRIRFNNPTERAVEISIAFDFIANLKNPQKILEIGNVLSHYENSLSENIGIRSRRIVDKFEVDLGVENQDLMSLPSDEKYDAIVSISSVEHIGQGDDPSGGYGEQIDTRDLECPLKAIAKIYDLLALDGKALITVPFGRLTDAEWYIQFSKEYLDVLWQKYGIPKDAISANYLKLIDRETVDEKHYMLWKEVDAQELRDSEYGWPWSQANAIAIIELSKLASDFNLNLNVEPTPLYYNMTYEQRREFEQCKSQLHQTQRELAQSQSQLYQTQTELEQSLKELNQKEKELEVIESQVYPVQEELELAQSQLYQTQEEVAQYQSQLYQAQEELEQVLTQLHQTQHELEISQSQLQKIEGELELTQAEFYQIQEERDQFESQMYQAQEELELTEIQRHQIQEELEIFQAEKHQIQVELELSQAEQESTRQELEQSQLQLNLTRQELDRRFHQIAIKNTVENNQDRYGTLVWEAWYAYSNRDMAGMSHCLQNSLNCTPFSPTETVLNWLEKFSQFSLKNSKYLDTNSLSNSPEWTALMRRVIGVKTNVMRN
ncbi:MAG TPA: hypothetical protein VK211_00340 [Kamptonema sp.]|nr:hypothetical protein [Kamptonema sp.]